MNTWSSKAEFRKVVRSYSNKIGITVNTLALRPMKNKWASCSTDGNLNFNIELLQMDKMLGEYVIVHELLHFVAPNHSKLWKSLMRAYINNYEDLEARLKNIKS